MSHRKRATPVREGSTPLHASIPSCQYSGAWSANLLTATIATRLESATPLRRAQRRTQRNSGRRSCGRPACDPARELHRDFRVGGRSRSGHQLDDVRGSRRTGPSVLSSPRRHAYMATRPQPVRTRRRRGRCDPTRPGSACAHDRLCRSEADGAGRARSRRAIGGRTFTEHVPPPRWFDRNQERYRAPTTFSVGRRPHPLAPDGLTQSMLPTIMGASVPDFPALPERAEPPRD